MLVIIQGKVIDTEKIYAVSESRMYDDEVEATFTIYFIEGNKIKIESKFISTMASGSDREKVLARLERARQELLAYWNHSKSPIPTIEV